MTNTEDLDISGLDKAELLRRLFNASRPLGLGALQPYEAEMSHEEAQELCDEYAKLNARFDYIRGRVIKVKFEGVSLKCAWLYDRDNGMGRCAAIVSQLRAETPVREETATP